jgi:hypothetical protein
MRGETHGRLRLTSPDFKCNVAGCGQQVEQRQSFQKSWRGARDENRRSHGFGLQVKDPLTIRVLGERFEIVMAVETYDVEFVWNLDVCRDDASRRRSQS